MADPIAPQEETPKAGPPSTPPRRPRRPRAAAENSPKKPPVNAVVDEEPTPTPTPYRMTDIGRRLEDMLKTVAGAAALVNPADGFIIAQSAQDVAESWDRLARRNPNVKRFLEQLLSGGDWGGVVISTGGMLVAIGMNHGLNPFGLFTSIQNSQEPERVSPIVPPAPTPEPGVSGSGESPTGPAAVSLPQALTQDVPGADPPPPIPSEKNGGSTAPSGASIGLP